MKRSGFKPRSKPLKSRKGITSRVPLKKAAQRRTGPRNGIRKVGPIGEANIEANKLIRAQNPPQFCEIRRADCKGGLFLTIAHRHKRSWYKGSAEKLSDKKQWVVACVVCHDQIEHDAVLTEDVFMRLRGEE